MLGELPAEKISTNFSSIFFCGLVLRVQGSEWVAFDLLLAVAISSCSKNESKTVCRIVLLISLLPAFFSLEASPTS